MNNNIKPATATATVAFIKAQLASNPAWAERAIVRLHARQTADEQQARVTGHDNGVGFNGTDAFILSSFAEQINKAAQRNAKAGTVLSAKQLAIAYRKLPKYAKQVMGEITPEKLEALKAKVAMATSDQPA
jgi:hypothetical protein